jgi:hypothetical protein
MRAPLSRHPSRGGVSALPKLAGERPLQDLGGPTTGFLCSPDCGATFAIASAAGVTTGSMWTAAGVVSGFVLVLGFVIWKVCLSKAWARICRFGQYSDEVLPLHRARPNERK